MYLSCIVMASGKGRRFGGNKLLAPLEEKPMIAYVLDSIPTESFDEILVVTSYPEVAELAEERGFRTVWNRMEQAGIGDTIRIGMGELSPESEGCMFCVGDQPFQRKESLQRLVRLFQQQNRSGRNAIAALGCQGERGNPVLFPKACYAELRALEKEQSGSAVIKRHPDWLIISEVEEKRELTDVDSPDDFAQRGGKSIGK